MDYIKYIRSLVGSSPINFAGVNVIIYNDKHEILLQKRGEHPVGKWGLIGGIVELGESLEDAAIREVKEETSLDICDLKLFGTTSGKQAYMRFPNGDEAYFVTVGFCTDKYKGELAVDNKETLDLKFFSRNELPEYMPKTHVDMINQFDDYIKK